MQYQKYLILLSLSMVFFASSSWAKTYPLYVETEPQDAIVKIMNIGPPYEDGIQLTRGCYHVRVIKQGYITQDRLVTITKKTRMEVNLKQDSITPKAKDRKLYIHVTTPHDAKIKIRGVPFDKGEAFPLEAFLLELKKRKKEKKDLEIEVSSPAYETCHLTNVKVGVNRDLHLHVALEKIPPKIYNFSLSLSLEQGKYKIAITKLEAGTEQQCFEQNLIVNKDVSLDLASENKHTCGDLKTQTSTAQQSENGQQTNCHLRTIGDNVKEIFIKGQHTLEFIKIQGTTNAVNIALTKVQADNFFAKAKTLQPSNSTTPLVPFIFYAVSENPDIKVIPTFWIQKEPINPVLYQTIVPNSSSDRVSHDNAIKVVNKLNEWCKGKAQFELPNEEQFVYLARKFYNPVKTDQLRTCQELREKPSNTDAPKVKKLIGYQWQLTSSQCRIFDDTLSNVPKCNEEAYVKKGGSIEPKDATECMPEYRAESTPDIGEPNTTFRLILLESNG